MNPREQIIFARSLARLALSHTDISRPLYHGDWKDDGAGPALSPRALNNTWQHELHLEADDFAYLDRLLDKDGGDPVPAPPPGLQTRGRARARHPAGLSPRSFQEEEDDTDMHPLVEDDDDSVSEYSEEAAEDEETESEEEIPRMSRRPSQAPRRAPRQQAVPQRQQAVPQRQQAVPQPGPQHVEETSEEEGEEGVLRPLNGSERKARFDGMVEAYFKVERPPGLREWIDGQMEVMQWKPRRPRKTVVKHPQFVTDFVRRIPLKGKPVTVPDHPVDWDSRPCEVDSMEKAIRGLHLLFVIQSAGSG
jgi:hypothetical protein